VLIFVAVFLLREWISQNARPGVFEEDEIAGIPLQDPPVPNPPPANQPVQDARLLVPQRQGPLDVDVEARRQARLWRPHRPIPPNPRFEGLPRHFDDLERLELMRDPIHRPQNPRVDLVLMPPLPAVLPSENHDTRSVDTGEGKEQGDVVTTDHVPTTGKGKEKEVIVTTDPVPTTLDARRRMRRRIDDGDGAEGNRPLTEPDPSLLGTSNFVQSSSLSGSVSGRSTAIESTPFEFTFRLPADMNAEENIREPVPEMPARSLVALQTAMMTGSPIPEEEPRRRSIVFSPDLSPRALSPRPATPAVEDETPLKPLSASSSPTSSDLSFRHLPVSNSSPVAENSLGSSGLYRATSSERLTMPSSFTCPPEVLAAGTPSMPTRNLDRKKRTRDEMEDEFEHYFRDPQPAAFDPVDADGDGIDAPREVAHRFDHDHIADGEELGQLEVAPYAEDDSEDDEAPEHIFWDADADREDEEDDDEDVVDIGDFNVPNRPGAQAPAQPQVQVQVEQMNDGVDDLEAGVEDDMEGALEGMLTLHN
jgi:E3 ubiquitin-protein ligase MARCH6